MNKGIVLTLSFLITSSEVSVFNFSLSTDHEMGQPEFLLCINHPLSTIKTYLLSYSIHSLVSSFLNATADDISAKTEKSNGLHSCKACFGVLTTKNEPVANIIDGNVQLYVLSHIPEKIFKV